MEEVRNKLQGILTNAVVLAANTGLVYVAPMLLLVGTFFAAERIIDLLYIAFDGDGRKNRGDY